MTTTCIPFFSANCVALVCADADGPSIMIALSVANAVSDVLDIIVIMLLPGRRRSRWLPGSRQRQILRRRLPRGRATCGSRGRHPGRCCRLHAGALVEHLLGECRALVFLTNVGIDLLPDIWIDTQRVGFGEKQLLAVTVGSAERGSLGGRILREERNARLIVGVGLIARGDAGLRRA